MRHLKWGIMGTGMIATKFAQGLNTTDQATGLAVASRDKGRAEEFAKQHSIERAYGSYGELLTDAEVDVVYISLPNHLHAEWSIKCAQAGRHILCEKPVTLDAAELKRVLEVVRAHDVFFMEAFMYRCHPQWARLRGIIAAGTIGEVRIVQSSFAFNMGPNFDNIRMKHETAGGGLMDVGCYCVSFSRLVAGEEPIECKAVARIGDRSGVDEYATGVLRFPSGIVASFSCALQCGVPTCANVYGSKGNIVVTNPWFPADGNASLIVQADGKSETIDITHGRELYANEALTVAEHLGERQSPAMSWEDSLGQARAMDALRASMGLAWSCERAR